MVTGFRTTCCLVPLSFTTVAAFLKARSGVGWRGRGPSCVPLPLHPQPSPCWPAVGTAVGSTQENQHPLNRPLPRPLTCCPPTALSLLPPIHSTTSGPSCERQKAGAPWGGVPIREEVKLASFPSPLSPLPIPTLSPRAVPPTHPVAPLGLHAHL